ncbi:MAG: ABC transporter permease [Sellimonas sp.]|uniref:ABC transporter permease n=1 Tax=Sellimonas sp. TaxID=2021466 RepID=UPI00399F31A2
MLNIIKMDLYRMRKMRSILVIWMVMAFILFFSTIMMHEEYADPVMNKKNQEEIAKNQDEAAEDSLGIYVLIPTEPGEKVTVYDMVYANTQGKVISLFIAIFSVLFSTADLRNGFIKNIGGQTKKRYHLIFSKAAVLFLFTVLTFAVTVAVQTISNIISFGYLEFGPQKEFLSYLLTEGMLHYGLALIVMGIAILISNNVISMTIAVCLCMNMTMILYGFVNKAGDMLFGETWNIVPYTVSGQIGSIGIHLTGQEALRGIWTAAIYGIVFVILSMFVFQKRDIR